MHEPKWRMLEFPKIADRRGNLSFIESQKHVPFDIRRTFFVYDIPSGENRGAHAHHALHQVIICLSGGLEVYLDDGYRKDTVRLNRPWLGLYIPPLVWAAEGEFDPGTVYNVLCSDLYNEADYYRDYQKFLAAVRASE